MSPSLLRSSALLAARSARPATLAPRQLLNSRFGSSSSHDHHGAEAGADVFPEEGFNAPFWTKLALAGIGLTLFLRISPASNPASSSDSEEPYLTRYIAHNLVPEQGLWRSRNEKHLELAVKQADDMLLMQEAERPKVRRMRYLGTFDQASPNGIPVGSQADLTDLVIKSEKEDFAKQE